MTQYNSTPFHTTNTEETPRIYVACLAAYNCGFLHGAWIDATLAPEAMMAEVRAMLSASPIPKAEERIILDYEGFDIIGFSEWDSFDEVHACATFITEHGRLGAALIAHTDNIDHAQAIMADGYAGCYESLADFAQELTENLIDIPEDLVYYIDYERMGRDMELMGEIFTIETAHDEVHVFWGH